MTQEQRRAWQHAATYDRSSPEYALSRVIAFATVTVASVIAALWLAGIGILAVFSAFGAALWWRRWRRGGWAP